MHLCDAESHIVMKTKLTVKNEHFYEVVHFTSLTNLFAYFSLVAQDGSCSDFLYTCNDELFST